MRSVDLCHDYPYPAKQVWKLVTSYDALHRVCAGRVSFTGVPACGFLNQGDDMHVQVRLFGWMPPQPYHMRVAICDPQAMRFRSSENGAGVSLWQHDLQVIATDTGARVRETVTIEAGWLTPLFALWARYLYRSRHAPRMALLRAGVIWA